MEEVDGPQMCVKERMTNWPLGHEKMKLYHLARVLKQRRWKSKHYNSFFLMCGVRPRHAVSHTCTHEPFEPRTHLRVSPLVLGAHLMSPAATSHPSICFDQSPHSKQWQDLQRLRAALITLPACAAASPIRRALEGNWQGAELHQLSRCSFCQLDSDCVSERVNNPRVFPLWPRIDLLKVNLLVCVSVCEVHEALMRVWKQSAN